MTVFGPYPATVESVHDGDTARLRLNLGFGITMSLSCRFDGINAPELNTDAGKAAHAFLLSVMHVGDTVTVASHGWDKYARFDGVITLADGTNVNQLMVSSGHALPYSGEGPKPV